MVEKIPYSIASLKNLKLKSEDILSGDYDSEIIARLHKVIDIESPITEELLCKRVLNSFSLLKMGNKLNKKFSSLLPEINKEKTKENNTTIYWRDRSECNYFRATSEKIRYSYQIPLSEAINVILFSKQNDITKDNKLLDDFAKNLEYKRKGRAIVNLFNKAKCALNN